MPEITFSNQSQNDSKVTEIFVGMLHEQLQENLFSGPVHIKKKGRGKSIKKKHDLTICELGRHFTSSVNIDDCFLEMCVCVGNKLSPISKLSFFHF